MDNHVEMQLDREMVLVELLNLSNSMTDYNISVARLGMHEIIENRQLKVRKDAVLMNSILTSLKYMRQIILILPCRLKARPLPRLVRTRLNC